MSGMTKQRILDYWFGYPDRAIKLVLLVCGATYISSYVIAKFWEPTPFVWMSLVGSVAVFVGVGVLALAYAGFNAVKGLLKK